MRFATAASFFLAATFVSGAAIPQPGGDAAAAGAVATPAATPAAADAGTESADAAAAANAQVNHSHSSKLASGIV